ncbi:C45 family autoproteolytic acyltransferase/hydolase [Flavobacterium terrigena]|uniref:Acyl-coenzyme A:6-aminopenicillanic acid acyl-transferase n=1 Tax=Flavobacterium terrigena TaxID=402734 RepID=A0A1H6QDF1_9FLAO|nr:C45 family peptidase [Flavobacterium terrigena]SEI41711.1 Acyl-coenzyme A:6-aminopenicillanic acid acyl-transferase [Flavobacterium terrigena]
MKNRLFFLFYSSVVFLSLVSCGIKKSLKHQPITASYNQTIPKIDKKADTLFVSGKNTLLKNKHQLWELYVEGDPLQIGLISGALTDSLLKKQETIFFSKIKDLVPSESKQKLLRFFLKWYNRKLYLNIPEEYKTEIYGYSRYSSKQYDAIAPAYLRSLYLHGAHDIGHALQDLALVGCSSFAAWDSKSEDGNLILGRNFDFYAGDDFAKDKVIAFIKPTQGNPFMIYTWAGMIGAVSGMNTKGLTITINAGKSRIPLIAKTPISILAREILQYASNINEAIAIAKKRKVFVSESIMIGSTVDNKAILIEVSPTKFDIFDVENSNKIICTNHFQSDAYKKDRRNLKQIRDSHSEYRFDKMTELFDANPKINPTIAADILRNTKGLNDKEIGFGNEKALNQLLAHHGIIFKPKELLVWVSANPYQLGEFVCYDLNQIFNQQNNKEAIVSFERADLTIAKDPFLNTDDYRKYEQFRVEDRKIDQAINEKKVLPLSQINNYQSLNSYFWLVYFKAGLYFYNNKNFIAAKEQFEKALLCEITTATSKLQVEKYLKKSKKKLK